MFKKFTNPFLILSDRQLGFLAMFSTVLGILFAVLFHARFDGCLDLHFVQTSSISIVVLELSVSVFLLVIILFLVGKFSNPKTRFLDILLVVLIARLPIYLLIFKNIGNYTFNKISELENILLHAKGNFSNVSSWIEQYLMFLLFTSIIGLLAMVYFFILLFNGYQTATNIKKTKHIIWFIIAVIVAEIISKIIFYQL